MRTSPLSYLVYYLSLRTYHSREDQNTTQPSIAGWPEARLATIWQRLVCGMYNTDYWKLVEGRHPYVRHFRPSFAAAADKGDGRLCGI